MVWLPAEAEARRIQMVVVARIEDQPAAIVVDTGTMMTQMIVAVPTGDLQMVGVVDQLIEIQVVGLLTAEMEAAVQGVPVAGPLHKVLTVEEVIIITVEEVIIIGVKAHQLEAVAPHQAMEEEQVAKKVLLPQGAKEHHIEQQRENRASALFSYLLHSKSFLWQSIQKKAGEKVEKVMREKKKGTLKSGRSGKKVTSRKQAIAIGLSEARKAGAKVPKKKSSGRKKSTS